MKIRHSCIVLLIFCAVLSCNQVLAANPEQGYIIIHSVDINLKQGYADLNVTYNIDGAVRFLILMVGEKDVRSKLLSLLNFPNATITRMNYDSADIRIDDINQVYGDGLYWFPAHEFATTIPELTIRSNQSVQTFHNSSRLENGVVYY